MDYYQILGLTKNASFDEIKKKYKELAIKYHPDKNPTKDAEDQFKKINEAYKTLSDPYQRGRYDALFEKQSYSEINDLFGMSFNNAMNMFNNLFRNDPFFSFGFNFPKFDFDSINLGRNNNNTQYSFYSSNTIQSLGENGKIQRKKHIEINNNGKKEKYMREYYVDEFGNEHIIKEEGNPNLTLNKRIKDQKHNPNLLKNQITDPIPKTDYTQIGSGNPYNKRKVIVGKRARSFKLKKTI
jgi:curved DNA-binding protein CbpA